MSVGEDGEDGEDRMKVYGVRMIHCANSRIACRRRISATDILAFSSPPRRVPVLDWSRRLLMEMNINRRSRGVGDSRRSKHFRVSCTSLNDMSARSSIIIPFSHLTFFLGHYFCKTRFDIHLASSQAFLLSVASLLCALVLRLRRRRPLNLR